MAARDSDYGAIVWHPASDALDRWADVYQAVARRNGAEPDAGRHLLRWAREAGLIDVTYSTSTWTFATAGRPGVVGRVVGGAHHRHRGGDPGGGVRRGHRDELAALGAAWRAWAADPDGVFTIVHGEILARI